MTRYDDNTEREQWEIDADTWDRYYYEMEVGKFIQYHAGRNMELKKVQLLKGGYAQQDEELTRRTEEAGRKGLLTWERHDEIWTVQMMFSGVRRDGSETPVIVLADVNLAAGSENLDRAVNRAGILASIVSEEVIPAVICESISPERKRETEEKGVTVIVAKRKRPPPQY